jgi:molecular chaperone DnaK (HSP70)
MLLLDVVPLSLGIETLGGAVDKLVHRNTTVPCRATTRYTTFVDNQTAININIFQGERELTKDCKPLGKFKLAGIPPMPAQMAQVDVTFLVDANGILTVSAKEQRSGAQAQVTVQAAHGLTQAEVESLVLDSVEHAHADFAARQFIELKNKADADLRHTERALAAIGHEVPAAEREKVEAARTTLLAAMQGTDVPALHRAADAFAAATAPLAERLMNSAVKTALRGKREDELNAEKL